MSRQLRFSPSLAQHTRFELRSLLLAAALGSLASTGCLRFGYADRSGLDGAKGDSGVFDASAAGKAGDAGRGDIDASTQAGSSGAYGASGASAADGGRVGVSGGAGGTTALTTDAGLDAGTSGALDAATEASTDAAAAEGGVATSPKCIERPGALFCDGFEVDDPDDKLWAYSSITNGALTRSNARAHSGSWSLRSTTRLTAGDAQARRATQVLAGQKTGDAWLRFYNWVPGAVQVTKHFSVGIISEASLPYAGFELRILPAGVDINTSMVIPGEPNVTFPRDRWVCVELHVLIDAVSGVYEAYLDGTLAVRSPNMDTTTGSGYSAAEVGVHYAPVEQGPTEHFVDDVVVSRSRVGCD